MGGCRGPRAVRSSWLASLLVTTGFALASQANAAEALTVQTLRPYLNNEINVLQLHHLFIQSMFALDSTPFTLATGVRAAPASYERLDGKTTDAGLGKVLYALSLGVGRPSSGVAVFGGINVSQVRPSGFPNVLALSGDQQNKIRASGVGAVFFGGLAVLGFAVEGAMFRKELSYDADNLGRFQPGGCNTRYGCSYGREPRSGAPVAEPPRHYGFYDNSFMLHLEQERGYSASFIFDTIRSIDEAGELAERRTVSAFKALAQPQNLANQVLGLMGAGLNRYAAGVDYYGDQVEKTRRRIARGESPPPARAKSMYEIPLLASGIAETGFDARAVIQAYPRPLFRLVEVGYSAATTLAGELCAQAGAQAKAFYRGGEIAPSADAFAGLFWMYSRRAVDPEAENKGLGLYVSYSYNSPDSLTFISLPDAHVLGIQLAYGNPMALPPPVANLKYPRELIGDTRAQPEPQGAQP